MKRANHPAKNITLLFLAFTIAMPLYSRAKESVLMVVCNVSASNVEISIDGTDKGQCPLNLYVNPGSFHIKALKKIDESWEQVFHDEIKIGDGEVKTVDVRLPPPRLNATAFQRASRSLESAQPPAQPTATITFADFLGAPETWAPLVQIMRSDLERGGYFRTIDSGGLATGPHLKVNVSELSSSNVGFVVGGSAEAQPDGRINIQFRALDLTKGVDIGGLHLLVPPRSLRIAAHKISDWLQEKIVGVPGTFERRIVEIVRVNDQFRLLVSESDHANPYVAVISLRPMGLPILSPSGTHVSYLSLESGNPRFIVQDLQSADRRSSPHSASLNSVCTTEIEMVKNYKGNEADQPPWMKSDWTKKLSAECAATAAASLWEY
jgi:hypothetical protein